MKDFQNIVNRLQSGDISYALWNIFIQDIDNDERKRIHKELQDELQANGFVVFKPENILQEQKIYDYLRNEAVSDYDKIQIPMFP